MVKFKKVQKTCARLVHVHVSGTLDYNTLLYCINWTILEMYKIVKLSIDKVFFLFYMSW